MPESTAQPVSVENSSQIAAAVREETDNLLTRGWTYGSGSKAFNVIIQNKDVIKAVQEQVKALSEANALSKENINSVNEANNLSKENTDAIKENTESIEENTHKSIEESDKQHKERKGIFADWKQTTRRVIEGIAKLSGFIAGRIDRENQLNRILAESNVVYDGTAKDMADYASKLGMTLNEYGEYLRNNSREFNLMQARFENGVQDISLDFKKIAQTSGATLQESQKGFATYSKLMAQTGQLSQMTVTEFNNGAAEFIKEVKGLARATGTNTETMLKQIEQNEQQYQMQALMNNENTRFAAMALQNMGMSPDQIVGVMTGVVSEELATQMAVNPQMRELVSQLQVANRQGGLQNKESLRATMGQIYQSESYQAATARTQGMKNDMTTTQIAVLAGQNNPFSGVYASSNIANGLESYAKNLDNGANAKLDKQIEAGVNREVAEKERDNRAEQMSFLGERLSDVNNTMAYLAGRESELYKMLNKLSYTFAGAMANIGIVGTTMNRYMPLIKGTMEVLISLDSSFKGLKAGWNVLKTIGTGIGQVIKFVAGLNPVFRGILAVAGVAGALYAAWKGISKWMGWTSDEPDKVAKSKEEIAKEVQEEQAKQEEIKEVETVNIVENENNAAEQMNYTQMTTNEILTNIARNVSDLVSNQKMNNYNY